MYRPRFLACMALAWLSASLLAGSVLAQSSYPERAVRIIVPFPPGGTADAMPRIVAEKLSARWNQPVLIENRPGAGGNIGADALARAEPDGYTLMSSPLGPVAANQFLFKKLSYDPTRFVPISVLGTTISVLAVRANLEARNAGEFIALAKSQPGKLTFASQGNGSTSHLTAAMFQQMTGTRMVHVPYKGTAPALNDLMGGQVDVFFDNISSSLAPHQAGRVRILAVAGNAREKALPDVPTLQESGLPGFFSSSWNVVVGPERLPAAIAGQISQALAEALRMPDVRQKYAQLGADVLGSTPEEARRFVAEERARWRKVIEDNNVRVD